MLEMLEDIRDIVKNDIEPYKPKTAKILNFTLSIVAIAIVSILSGTVGSLIVRSFTDMRPSHLASWFVLNALITFGLYGILQTVRAFQLYAGSGIMNDPKYVVVVEKHKDWLLKVSTGKFALSVAINAMIVYILLLTFDFEIKVQIGAWTSAIDSRAFALATLSIYCWDAWCDMGRAIKSWVECREHIKTRFGV